jgi:hypothetical protein
MTLYTDEPGRRWHWRNSRGLGISLALIPFPWQWVSARTTAMILPSGRQGCTSNGFRRWQMLPHPPILHRPLNALQAEGMQDRRGRRLAPVDYGGDVALPHAVPPRPSFLASRIFAFARKHGLDLPQCHMCNLSPERCWRKAQVVAVETEEF